MFTQEAMQCWSDERLELAEGIRWDSVHDLIVWVDITTGRLFTGRMQGSRLKTDTVTTIGPSLGAVAPVAEPHRGWICASGKGFRYLHDDGTIDDLVTSETDPPGVDARMNDAVCDPQGRFVAGTLDDLAQKPGAGRVLRLGPELQIEELITGTTISNGLGWSPDGAVMYFADSGAGEVSCFDVDPLTGRPERRRTFAAIDPAVGVPDGLTVDIEGGVWVAIWGGGRAVRFSADGELTDVVHVPASQVSSVCIYGDREPQLLITTAWEGFDDVKRAAEPDTGTIFVAAAPVSARPTTAFRFAR